MREHRGSIEKSEMENTKLCGSNCILKCITKNLYRVYVESRVGVRCRWALHNKEKYIAHSMFYAHYKNTLKT